MGYMIDTSVFNWILKGLYDIEDIPYTGGVYITQIQRDELAKTGLKDPFRKENLFGVLDTIGPLQIPTESGVVGPSVVGEFKVSDARKFDEIKAEMERRHPKKDHVNDALIAETALLNGHTLISADAVLCDAFEYLGGKVLRVRKKL